jgi:hypothetical protein
MVWLSDFCSWDLEIFRDWKFSLTTNEIFRTLLQVRLTDSLRVPKNNAESVGGFLIHRRRFANETFAPVFYSNTGQGIRVFEYWVIRISKGYWICIGFFYGYSMLPNMVEPILDLF